ncbi:MAG: hypothetical protein K2Q18_15220 [Bdellovibrionales bacterium]|nr:hypothetical protein [Bdellovibrionales bacterium]
MKSKTLTFLLLSLVSLKAFGQDIELPVIKAPSALQEGIQTELSAAQIAELLPWAKDSKMFLTDLLDSTQGLSMEEKAERLIYGIKQVVSDSGPKNSELLMRYVLNRGLVIEQTLSKEMNLEAVGTVDARVRALMASINMAIRYYDIDMKTLTKKSNPNFQVFGEEYFKFLSELNKSIFDASAQYNIQRTSLEWFQWDLYRDINNTRHAPKITKIYNALRMAPASKMTDIQYIKNIQQLKRVSVQLEVTLNTTAIEQVKPAQVSANVVVPFERDRASKYYYSTSSHSCYPLSASGDVITGSKISNAFCEEANSFYYSTNSHKCFKKSFSGDIMSKDIVDNVMCARPNEYYYITSSHKCYKTSMDGDVMISDAVDNVMCVKVNDYFYSTSSRKCFKMSLSGDIMLKDAVDNIMCVKANEYYYSSSSKACYKVSQSDEVMLNDKVSDSMCIK